MHETFNFSKLSYKICTLYPLEKKDTFYIFCSASVICPNSINVHLFCSHTNLWHHVISAGKGRFGNNTVPSTDKISQRTSHLA